MVCGPLEVRRAMRDPVMLLVQVAGELTNFQKKVDQTALFVWVEDG